MDKSAQVRWTILLGLLGLTLGAIVYPTDKPDAPREGKQIRQFAQSSQIVALPPQNAEGEESSPSEVNPFAPKNWLPPPLPAPVIKAAAAEAPTAPAAPAGPPPLPYKFMGRMNDGGEQVVYLSKGDQAILVRNGETVEGTYKVLSIEAQRIEFEYLPCGEKQSLTLPLTE